jgi:hypothetical protein
MARFKPRVGSITINGVDFPAIVNISLMIEMEKAGISIDGILSDDANRWQNLIWLITKAINMGYEVQGMPESVTETEVANAIDISDLVDITEQIAALLGQTGRKVMAEPPKN